MAKVTINVCDVCGNPSRPVKVWKVEVDGRKAEVALCAMHSGPLDKIMLQAKGIDTEPHPGPLLPERRPSRSPGVTPMSEIKKRVAANNGKKL